MNSSPVTGRRPYWLFQTGSLLATERCLESRTSTSFSRQLSQRIRHGRRQVLSDTGLLLAEMKQAYNRGKELTHMSKVKSVEIRCEHCQQWFTPILTFGTSEAFDTSGLEGNLHQCRNSNCRKFTGCNKENMRVLFEDGGFVGDKTSG